MTDPHLTLDPAPPTEAHLGWLQPTRALAGRVMQHVGEPLRRLAQGRRLLLAVGHRGSHAAPLLIEADAAGVRATLSEASLEALLERGFVALPDPVAPEEPVSTTALGAVDGRPVEGLAPGDALLVAMAVQTACLDHLAAVLADAPSARCPGAGGAARTSKAWLYDVLANLPGLTGVDHSAALLMPAQLHGDEHPHYVVAAERVFVRAGHRLPASRQDHLVGLLIPCWGGQGGLLEEAVAQQRRDPAATFHLFVPTTEGGDAMERWRLLGSAAEEDDALVGRFRVDAAREHEELLVLIPLAVPGQLPAFLSLNYTQPTALPASTAAIFERLSERFADALTGSDLFRLPAERLEVFEAFGAAAAAAGATNRATFIHHLTPHLHQRLGAASVSIGLVQPGAADDDDATPRLVFENPQGWDLDQPLAIPHLRADSLAALAMRMRRPLLLAGGHAVIPGAPAIRWNNSLVVNERLNRVVDRRMAPALGLTLRAEEGWRALAEYYKPTTSLAVYVAVAAPLVLNGEVIGVLALDFERATPWGAYSGFAAERLHQTLAGLITSHLALLPP